MKSILFCCSVTTFLKSFDETVIVVHVPDVTENFRKKIHLIVWACLSSLFIYGRLLILIPEYSPFRPSAGISFSDTELPVYLCTGTAQRLCCEFVRNSVKKVRWHRTFLTYENPCHPR